MAGYIDASRPPGLWSAEYNPRHELLEAPRSIQVGWARRRRIDRAARREEAGRSRTVERLAKLGAAWRVLDIEDLGLPIRNTFLTIGPGGVFLVLVKPQGRSRVRLAGDVVQVDGRRHKFLYGGERPEAPRQGLAPGCDRELDVVEAEHSHRPRTIDGRWRSQPSAPRACGAGSPSAPGRL